MQKDSKKNLKLKRISDVLRRNLKKRKNFQNKFNKENKKNDIIVR